MSAESWTLVDCHVHVHPQFDPVRLLDAAADNFRSAGVAMGLNDVGSGVLLLTEMSHADWFGTTRQSVAQDAVAFGRWQMNLTPEAETLVARERGGSRQLHLICGRQINTAERIEVLALLTRAQVADGMPLDATLAECHAAGALVALPWGVGKWLGMRGRLVKDALSGRFEGPPVYAGDNSGRPWFWPRPGIFASLESQGRPVLPGTDPLPLADQVSRVGAYGLALAGGLADAAVASALRSRLMNGWDSKKMRPFGRQESVPRFIINQLRLRL